MVFVDSSTAHSIRSSCSSWQVRAEGRQGSKHGMFITGAQCGSTCSCRCMMKADISSHHISLVVDLMLAQLEGLLNEHGISDLLILGTL